MAKNNGPQAKQQKELEDKIKKLQGDMQRLEFEGKNQKKLVEDLEKEIENREKTSIQADQLEKSISKVEGIKSQLSSLQDAANKLRGAQSKLTPREVSISDYPKEMQSRVSKSREEEKRKNEPELKKIEQEILKNEKETKALLKKMTQLDAQLEGHNQMKELRDRVQREKDELDSLRSQYENRVERVKALKTPSEEKPKITPKYNKPKVDEYVGYVPGAKGRSATIGGESLSLLSKQYSKKTTPTQERSSILSKVVDLAKKLSPEDYGMFKASIFSTKTYKDDKSFETDKYYRSGGFYNQLRSLLEGDRLRSSYDISKDTKVDSGEFTPQEIEKVVQSIASKIQQEKAKKTPNEYEIGLLENEIRDVQSNKGGGKKLNDLYMSEYSKMHRTLLSSKAPGSKEEASKVIEGVTHRLFEVHGGSGEIEGVKGPDLASSIMNTIKNLTERDFNESGKSVHEDFVGAIDDKLFDNYPQLFELWKNEKIHEDGEWETLGEGEKINQIIEEELKTLRTMVAKALSNLTNLANTQTEEGVEISKKDQKSFLDMTSQIVLKFKELYRTEEDRSSLDEKGSVIYKNITGSLDDILKNFRAAEYVFPREVGEGGSLIDSNLPKTDFQLIFEDMVSKIHDLGGEEVSKTANILARLHHTKEVYDNALREEVEKINEGLKEDEKIDTHTYLRELAVQSPERAPQLAQYEAGKQFEDLWNQSEGWSAEEKLKLFANTLDSSFSGDPQTYELQQTLQRDLKRGGGFFPEGLLDIFEEQTFSGQRGSKKQLHFEKMGIEDKIRQGLPIRTKYNEEEKLKKEQGEQRVYGVSNEALLELVKEVLEDLEFRIKDLGEREKEETLMFEEITTNDKGEVFSTGVASAGQEGKTKTQLLVELSQYKQLKKLLENKGKVSETEAKYNALSKSSKRTMGAKQYAGEFTLLESLAEQLGELGKEKSLSMSSLYSTSEDLEILRVLGELKEVDTALRTKMKNRGLGQEYKVKSKLIKQQAYLKPYEEGLSNFFKEENILKTQSEAISKVIEQRAIEQETKDIHNKEEQITSIKKLPTKLSRSLRGLGSKQMELLTPEEKEAIVSQQIKDFEMGKELSQGEDIEAQEITRHAGTKNGVTETDNAYKEFSKTLDETAESQNQETLAEEKKVVVLEKEKELVGEAAREYGELGEAVSKVANQQDSSSSSSKNVVRELASADELNAALAKLDEEDLLEAKRQAHKGLGSAGFENLSDSSEVVGKGENDKDRLAEYINMLKERYKLETEIYKLKDKRNSSSQKGDLVETEALSLQINNLSKYQKELLNQMNTLENSDTGFSQKSYEKIISTIKLQNLNLQHKTTEYDASATTNAQAKAEREYQTLLNARLSLEKQVADAQKKIDVSGNKREKETLQEIINIASQRIALKNTEISQLNVEKTTREAVRKDIELNYAMQRATLKAQTAAQNQGAQNIWQVMQNDIKRATMRIFDMGVAYKALNQIPQQLRKIVELTKQLDASMTNLRIVTNGSTESATALLNTYQRLGSELGVTTQEVSTSAVEWLRQGYNTAEVGKLIESSMKLSKLGMIDASEATQYMTSALKGFKLEVEDAITVVDKLTTIDLEAAVSAGGLAQALSKTATSAQLAGLSMDQTLGVVATIGEVTQKSMDSVGVNFSSLNLATS